jgi:hypothetical protein
MIRSRGRGIARLADKAFFTGRVLSTDDEPASETLQMRATNFGSHRRSYAAPARAYLRGKYRAGLEGNRFAPEFDPEKKDASSQRAGM